MTPAGTTYIVRAADTDLYKIGYTSGDPEARVRQYATGSPYDLDIIATIPGERWERFFHQTYEDRHVRGEWFLIPWFHHYAKRLLDMLYEKHQERPPRPWNARG